MSSNSEQSEMGKDFFSAHKIEKEDIGMEAAPVQIRYGPQGKGGGEGDRLSSLGLTHSWKYIVYKKVKAERNRKNEVPTSKVALL